MNSFRRLISFALFFSSLSSCSQDGSQQNSPGGTSTINGKPFNVAVADATDTGKGLYILLKDNTGQEVALYIPDAAGTYPVKSPTAVDFDARTNCVATIVSSNDLSIATSGSVTISKSTNGKLEGSYTLTQSQPGGETSGIFQALSIQSVPSGECLVSSIKSPTYLGYGGADMNTLCYDVRRRLVKSIIGNSLDVSGTVVNPVITFYFWQNDRIVEDINIGTNYVRTWTYQNNLLSKIATSPDITYPKSWDFSYDQSSRLQSLVITGGPIYKSIGYLYTYDVNGNISQVLRSLTSDGSTNQQSTTFKYSNYDDFNNPESLVARAIDAQTFPDNIFLNFDGIILPAIKHNFRNMDYPVTSESRKYTYDYNGSQYPVKVSELVGINSLVYQTYEIAYYGCN